MTVYTNENRPALLEFGDRVVFSIGGTTIEYDVCRTYLALVELTPSTREEPRINSVVFDVLGINQERKNHMAESLYGYRTRNCGEGADWPEYRHNDFEAATLLVKAIYRRIDMLPKEETTSKAGWKVGDEVVILGTIIAIDDEDKTARVVFKLRNPSTPGCCDGRVNLSALR